MFLTGDIGALLNFVFLLAIVFTVLFIICFTLCFKKVRFYKKLLLAILFFCLSFYVILIHVEFFANLFI